MTTEYINQEEQSNQNYLKVIHCKECRYFNGISVCTLPNGLSYPGSDDYCSHAVRKQKTVRFLLDGCDISFVAEAPANITLEQLLKQADRIKPEWCACGIRSLPDSLNTLESEIVFTYTGVTKTSEDVPCDIQPEKG